MKRGKRVTVALKRRAVERVAKGEGVSAVAVSLGINRQRIYEWQEQVRQGGVEALRQPGRPRKGTLSGLPRRAMVSDGEGARRRIAELERKIGEQQGDLDFFRQALRHVKVRQQAATVCGAQRSTKSSRR